MNGMAWHGMECNQFTQSQTYKIFFIQLIVCGEFIVYSHLHATAAAEKNSRYNHPEFGWMAEKKKRIERKLNRELKLQHLHIHLVELKIYIGAYGWLALTGFSSIPYTHNLGPNYRIVCVQCILPVYMHMHMDCIYLCMGVCVCVME